jgi:EAL and modified HD-GYP domain-containing signal transduction protein
MAQSVLGSLTLGYQLLWNQLRQLAGVQLFIDADESDQTLPIDARHLLEVLRESWSEQAPQLILSTRSSRLLSDLLEHTPVGSLWIEVHEALLDDPTLAQSVHQAHQRGLALVWRGEDGQRPGAAMKICFAKHMITLSAEEALAGLRVSLHQHSGSDAGQNVSPGLQSPVEKGHIYEAVASRALIEHCLDEQAAWGVAGWPMEDVLHGYRQQLIQPSHRAIVKLVEAVDTDESMEAIEHILSEEPLLAYRFLRYTNSAALGLRTGIESLRHGLMVLGYSQLRNWLLAQLPHATSDLNLQPVRAAMVVRAHLMAHLLDAGDGDDLRREVYLCGLLSQIDLLVGEPLTVALQRIPVPERIISAIMSNSGPYSPYLDIAIALESANTHRTRMLCDAHKVSPEDANRALLRTLSSAQLHPARGLLLV